MADVSAVTRQRLLDQERFHFFYAHVFQAGAAFAGGATVVSADESGISFWVPGTYGALAAAPLPQGFSIAEIYYHSPIKGGGDVAIARQIPIAGVTTKVSASLDIHIGVQNDLLLSIPSYVFATPVLGGQLQIGMLIPYGRNKVFVDQTIVGPMGVLGGPPISPGSAIWSRRPPCAGTSACTTS